MHPKAAMSGETLAFLFLGAAAGGFVNGLAGFGTALFALGWWLQIMPPLQAVPIVLFMSVVSGVQGMILVRRDIRWGRLALFVLPALAGIPLGLQVLHLVDATFLKVLIAAFLLVYGGFFLFRRELPAMTRATPLADGCIGFLGGVLGAVAGLSGALPTMWLALRDWTKGQSRAVLQPFNVVVLGVAAALLAVDGAYDRAALTRIAIVLPATLVATRLGIIVFRRLSDSQFRRLLIVLMFVSGAALLVRELA